MENYMSVLEKIQNQIKNTEALSKFIQPTGVSQEYTPVINFTELGFDLLNTMSIQLKAKELGLELINGEEVKVVYSKLNCVTNYEEAECYTELHQGINQNYKTILTLAIEDAANTNKIDSADKDIFISQIKNINKTVHVRQDKPRIKLKT